MHKTDGVYWLDIKQAPKFAEELALTHSWFAKYDLWSAYRKKFSFIKIQDWSFVSDYL